MRIGKEARAISRIRVTMSRATTAGSCLWTSIPLKGFPGMTFIRRNVRKMIPTSNGSVRATLLAV